LLYIDGEIYAIAATTDSHNTIALNLALLIRNHLRGGDCRVYFADIKAPIEKRNRFSYPDLLVTCDPKNRETPTYKRFPKHIIKVLSDCTEAFDRAGRFHSPG
jgi:Uma2 family endonuclease